MKVQDILDDKRVLEFLREKGLKEEKDYYDDEYTEGNYFRIDKRKLLVVYEASENNLKEIKDHFLIDRGLSYCLIVLDRKLIFLRSFGEPKYFIYSERTKNMVSKIDRLKEIDTKGFDFIFHAGKDISAMFYETFKLKRDVLVQHIKNDVEPIQKYLIAQKIFDRVFFIYFLCHKGIIKVNDKQISGKNIFEILLKEKDFFQALKDLFHKFNVPGTERTLKIKDYALNVPYLNGGLFRPDIFEQKLDVSLKNSKWEEIFEFLNSFHWIIEDVKATEENEDKILTPEILGHVYERSVVEWEMGIEKEAEDSVKNMTERNKKGVYYTPEPITEYISNNTIKPYLMEKLGKQYASFEELIESGNKKDEKEALSILDEIRVLDPACGSGAFLIKASEIIFNLKRRLNYEVKNRINPYDLKLEIITKNVYGVDMLAGATEISKLRLWLWLISDYEENKNEIKALPNIEYNLRVGNSLIGWLDEKLVQMPMNTPLTEKVDGILTGLIAFSENGDIENLKNARNLLESYKLNDYIEAYYILYSIYRKTHGLRAENLRNIIETIRQSIYKTVTPAFLDYVNSKILGIEYGKPQKGKSAKHAILRGKPPVKRDDLEKLQVFHWRIDFGHIMLNGGFDVIIGNPPYGNILKDIEKEIISYYATANASEVAANFIERGIYLMNEYSYIGQIVANSICINKSTNSCRSFIKQNLASCKFALFGTRPAKIFGDAEIRAMLLVGKKENGLKLDSILTTEAIKLTQQNKDTILNNLSFESTKGLELGENRIGDGIDESLPKVGNEIIRGILLKLKNKSNLTFRDVVVKKGKFQLEMRKTGGYWLNALEKMPYSSTKIESISLNNETCRNAAILMINSSLFYLYWSTYGNLRDLPPETFYKFPAPSMEFVNANRTKINQLKPRLESKLLKYFEADTGRVGEFRTAKCKDVIDEIDGLFSEYYGLNSKETSYVISYDQNIRPNQSC